LSLTGISTQPQYYGGPPLGPGQQGVDDYSWSNASLSAALQLSTSPGAQLQSYLYADGRPVAQAQATQSLSLVSLALQGAEPVYGSASGGNDNGEVSVFGDESQRAFQYRPSDLPGVTTEQLKQRWEQIQQLLRARVY
jgi:hypothetical protein